jgi:pimeloyl-ACP methyl ester carboxylesterase
MARESVTAVGPGGELVGWVEGDGPPVLLLHGGPGLSYGYLDPLAAELGDGYRRAGYQQRGLAPSTTEGPFTVVQAVADVGAFLDALGWARAFVVGHSWGGHLLLHLAVSTPQRLRGGLVVDPLGGVGDGGMAVFEREMAARIPEESRRRAVELDERALRGEGTPQDMIDSLRLFWPAYFASPAEAPPMPDIRTSIEAYSGLVESLTGELPRLTGALPGVTVPLGFVAGAGSPMPVAEAAGATSAVIPGAWLDVIEGGGHFPWYEEPGRVRAALDRLVGETGASGGGSGDR